MNKAMKLLLLLSFSLVSVSVGVTYAEYYVVASAPAMVEVVTPGCVDEYIECKHVHHYRHHRCHHRHHYRRHYCVAPEAYVEPAPRYSTYQISVITPVIPAFGCDVMTSPCLSSYNPDMRTADDVGANMNIDY